MRVFKGKRFRISQKSEEAKDFERNNVASDPGMDMDHVLFLEPVLLMLINIIFHNTKVHDKSLIMLVLIGQENVDQEKGGHFPFLHFMV